MNDPSGNPSKPPGPQPSRREGLPAATVPDHELLRRIGEGSYGEVWLARNVLGEFRAVKIIYRRAFEHDRPYEREFEGIRRFEPISRAHPSQLNVLHVGRDDRAGYFYYVMELADSNSDEWPVKSDRSTPSLGSAPPAGSGEVVTRHSPLVTHYVPHTLQLDLHRQGRLPVDDCLRIGLALTTALEHLHAHGLVHRDVKPSNIIFVNGTPKLADIGLVAATDATQSFVGTSGFLPPEGPGHVQGDLYSLGKVLYEMSMGRDRQEFPKLPANLADSGDVSRLLELNAVILKACQNDPRQRYHSAKELAADLVLLQRGHSVRRLRTIERRLAHVTKAGAAVSVMLVLAAGLYWNTARQARATERQLYVADMNRALQSWEGGNLALARELLDEHRRRQPDLLGFEWRLLAQLCRQSDARFTLRGHDRTVWCLAFSPDSRTLATGSGDGTVKLWDAGTGRLLRTQAAHRGFVHALAFSPDGRRLATGSRDFTVRLWDVRTGTETATLTGHRDAVRAVAFTPDGSALVSAGEDYTLRWWNPPSTEEVASVATGLSVEQLAFSPDGRVLAACGGDNRTHFWNSATRQEDPPAELHQALVLAIAYAPDGRMLASGGFDGTIRLWDPATRRELAILGRGAPVRCLAFTPGNRFLAAATDDGLIRLWDVTRSEPRATLRGHSTNVRALAIAPDGRLLASGDEDGVVKLWEVAGEPGRDHTLPHRGIVNGLAFAPNGHTLVSTDPNTDTLRLWDTTSQQLLAGRQAHTRAVWSVAFAPDGTAIASGGIDGSVQLWNPTNLTALALLGSHAGAVDALAFSPDGRFLATGGRDGTVRLRHRISGQESHVFEVSGGPIRAVAFAPDGRLLASGGLDGSVRLWNLKTFVQSTRLAEHRGEVRALAFSPDGRLLVSGGADKMIRVWEMGHHRRVTVLAGHAATVSSLAFSGDGRTLASGSWDSTVKLWHCGMWAEVAALRAHSGQVTQVAFSPDGNTLASASSDGTVRLWLGEPPTQ
jgi:WD40 repeat protein